MQLYLLERDRQGRQGTVTIGKAQWRLTSDRFDILKTDDKSFTCVSYVWGSGRESNPFQPSSNVSDRTLPALRAVMSCRPSCDRIWVDAFCVPVDRPEKIYTIERMGYIYARAREVVVVLSAAAHPILEQMRVSDRLKTEHLDDLEKEEWVSRAWTYQEAMNSREFFITCEGPDNAIIHARHFLNCLGQTLSHFEGTAYIKKHYPHLDTLQDLITDYLGAAYPEPSALGAMSQMDRRHQQFSQDHFYAMMGAISTKLPSFNVALDPCEAFMSLCESKGDYSFIYSSAKRDSAPTRHWRPAAGGLLPSILQWPTWGIGQPAHEESGSLYLDKVVLLKNLPLEDSAKAFIEVWLASDDVRVSETTEIELAITATLEARGFEGSSQCITTTHGFFIPTEWLSVDEDWIFVVATGVGWNFGAPGLACRHGSQDLYVPGVFCGRVDETAATSFKIS
ncbi:hypothetical protein F5Y19DRAFT_454728 [Xylariaceae sp. FL1651]|nr:hypothetical protein F5Y19DRAFT_454728 [Xylariaceae sp. FL1651]